MPVHAYAPRVDREAMPHAATELPRRLRLTVDDHCRMAGGGILAPDACVELIDGDIIDRVPPGDLHIVTSMHLGRARRAAEDHAFVLVQSPVRRSRFSQLQPDLARRREWAEDEVSVSPLGARAPPQASLS
jgi:hypothetical protein